MRESRRFIMKRLVTTAIIVAAGLVLLCHFVAGEEKDPLCGKYSVKGWQPGVEPGPKPGYKATLEIKRTGDVYSLTWTFGSTPSHVGVGIYDSDKRLLAVSYLDKKNKSLGVVLYSIGLPGTLEGRWSVLGDPKGRIGVERCMKM
jgi:hypothetical protein